MRLAYFLLLCFILPLPVLGAPACRTPIVSCGGLDCGFCSFVDTLDNLLCYAAFYFTLPAAVVALIIVGFVLLTAAGSLEKIKKAKRASKYILWGLLLVFTAYFVINLALGNLLDLGYIPIWQTFPGCDEGDAEITPLPPPPPAVCGDGSCNGDETCHVCPPDCGECVLPPPFCGDEECNGEEDCFFCPEDCGECEPYCGDGACGLDEDCESCHADCGWCWELEFCGDGACNGDETCDNCPADCGGLECFSFGECSGTPVPCSTYGDSISCAAVTGCVWTPVEVDPGEDPSGDCAACLACWDSIEPIIDDPEEGESCFSSPPSRHLEGPYVEVPYSSIRQRPTSLAYAYWAPEIYNGPYLSSGVKFTLTCEPEEGYIPPTIDSCFEHVVLYDGPIAEDGYVWWDAQVCSMTDDAGDTCLSTSGPRGWFIELEAAFGDDEPCSGEGC